MCGAIVVVPWWWPFFVPGSKKRQKYSGLDTRLTRFEPLRLLLLLRVAVESEVVVVVAVVVVEAYSTSGGGLRMMVLFQCLLLTRCPYGFVPSRRSSAGECLAHFGAPLHLLRRCPVPDRSKGLLQT